MMSQYNAGVIQTTYQRCKTRADVKANLEHIAQIAIRSEVHRYGLPVSLFAISEGAIHGWPHQQRGAAKGCYADVINSDVVTTVPGEETDFLGELCRKYGFYLIGQMQVLDPDFIEDRVFNMAFILDPNGKVIHRHRKTSFAIFEAESSGPGDIWDLYLQKCGDDPVALLREMYPVTRTPIGNIGTLVCAEGTWPETGRALALNGAEIIWRSTYSEPSLFNETWEVQNRSHAIANTCYVLSPNHGNVNHGRSQIYDWHGHILAEAPYIGDAYLTAMLDINSLREFRVRSLHTPSASIRAEQYLQIYRAAEAMGVSYPSNLYMKGIRSMESIGEIHKQLINRMVQTGCYTPPPNWKPYDIDPELVQM